jgi:dynein heavy chain
MSLFEGSFPEVLRYAVQNLTFKMEVLEAFIIRQACDLMQGLIPSKDEKDGGAISRDHYERIYIFTLMWSIGAFLEIDDRVKMEEFIRKADSFKLILPDIPSDSDQTMFDYMVDTNG